MAENLVEGKIEVRPIVFVDHSPKISAEAFVALCRALNKKRPRCVTDYVPQYFIAPKSDRAYGA